MNLRVMKYLIYGRIQEAIKMLINGINAEIIRKEIKNINLKVYPNLKVKVSAPINMEMPTIKRMIVSKEEWINQKLKKYEEQIRLTKRKYVSGEDHYLNGKRYILKVIDSNTPSVKKENNKTLIMYVRKSSSVENKKKLMNLFYKEYLERKLHKYIPEIEKVIGVESSKYSIRQMKNKWGSCNSENKVLMFNVDLAKKSDSEIKYVVIHELIHLIEKKHNDHFKELLNIYCPKWKTYQDSLNEVLNANKIC